MDSPKNTNHVKSFIKSVLFESKWVLIIFYFGLVAAQCFYCIKFCQEIVHLSSHFWKLTESDLMLAVLGLIDLTMIANLIKMIISGSYHNFLEKTDDAGTEKVSSGLLKVKMGSSLVGISSIHLLQTFINSASLNDRDIIIKCSIHLIFLASTMGLAYIDYLHNLHTDKNSH